ncbi:Uncharacterized protein TCM_015777 [Theobroma cacao]|uniref:Uncharacterized protein n=1 Tax=Theobroma cacao TaxID=3641 RepID=A0A061G2I5_THECC|nr:Uncharacterized protein TCM_015777 [Theobroma cacao]
MNCNQRDHMIGITALYVKVKSSGLSTEEPHLLSLTLLFFFFQLFVRFFLFFFFFYFHGF